MNSNIQAIDNSRLGIEYYGADFPVDVLVHRMQKGDYIIPGFQRGYVWDKKAASRFIESLLLGLPIPTLFLAKDKFSGKYIVIDGQQRLKTLQYFYEEKFPDSSTFKLQDVASAFNELTYTGLPSNYRRLLDNAIIHCTIVSESYDSMGIYYIFERLNTTGTALTAQEVRSAVYHGSFNDLLQLLSESKEWQALYDNSNNRGEAQELILRFIAFHYERDSYQGRIIDFLNWFMLEHKDLEKRVTREDIERTFYGTVLFVEDNFGKRAFYRNNRFSKVLYDVLMLFTSRHLEDDDIQASRMQELYGTLLQDSDFWKEQATSVMSKRKLQERLTYVESIYSSLR